MDTNALLRVYVSMARGARFGDTGDFAYDECISVHPNIHTELAELRTRFPEYARIRGIDNDYSSYLHDRIRDKWGDEGTAKIDALRIFVKPTDFQNLVYSREISRRWDVQDGEYWQDGLFVLPKGNGFIVPQYDGANMIGLRFFLWSVTNRKRKEKQ